MSYPAILARFTPDPDKVIPTKEEIVFANIGCNRVISNSAEIKQPTFESVKLRRSGPLIIHEKRWYFRLVCNKQIEKKTSRALMDDYNLNDISRHMVVCFTPDKLPGQDKPFRTKDNEFIHLFAFFDSYVEFFNYMLKFTIQERSFYEIIFGELPQKPHFDIDIDLYALLSVYPHEDINKVGDILTQAVIQGCIEVLQEHLITIDMERDILLYSSHGEKKRSFHIVLNNKCHDGNKEAKAFYDAVMNKVNTYMNGKYIDFVDKSVYGPRQQFRLMGSQKIGSGRTKLFHESFIYKDITYNHVFNEDVSDLTIKKLTVLYESMSSFVSGCTYLPSLIPPKPLNQQNFTDMPDLEADIIEQCMKMLRDKMTFCPFSVITTNGHLILLKRNAPSHCPICKKDEPHRAENPYIYVICGKVYWDCRRAPTDAKKLFLGYLAMTVDELKLSGVTACGDDNSSDEGEGEFMFGDYVMSPPTLPIVKKESNSVIKKDERVKIENTLPVDQRMQDIQGITFKMSKEKEDKKYARHDPIDGKGVVKITSTFGTVPWNAKFYESKLKFGITFGVKMVRRFTNPNCPLSLAPHT